VLDDAARMRLRLASVVLLASALATRPAEARVILQYFETDWKEIEARLPELALLGYDALWLPPPQKGAEGLRDVGFSVYDRFDLGDVDQRGTVRTRYGTRAELLSMSAVAHRLGLRVIFDVVMNHNANPALIENGGVALDPVGLGEFPDTVPLDYHVLPARPLGGGAYEALRPAELGGGTFVVAPGSPENPEAFVPAAPMPAELAGRFPGFTQLIRTPRVIFDADLTPFENQSYALLGLADLALDLSGQNATLGAPLPRWVRQPDCPACYPDGVPVAENIVEYVLRWVVWLRDTTGADGFRLDAVRHVPTDFFTRFNQAARAGHPELQLFGESFTGDIEGELAAYHATGMQMLNFPLFFRLDGLLSAAMGGRGDLGQLSFPQGGDGAPLAEFGGLGRAAGVAFAQSHDSPPPSGQPNLAYAFILTRPGDAVVFFDGNNPDPRSFVQPGRADALGELGSRVIRDLVYVHEHFARGGMWNRFVDADAYVYERAEAGQATLLAVLHDRVGGDDARFDGVARPLVVTGFPPGTVLVDYTGNSPLHETTVLDPATVPAAQRARALAAFDAASDVGPPPGYGLVRLAVPPGPERGYAMYAPRVPQGPKSGARAVAILQAGQRVEDVTLATAGEKRTASGTRVAAHRMTVARVSGTLVSVQVRTDASAEQVVLRLDAGGEMPMKPAGVAAGGELLWALEDLDASAWRDGVHVVRARASRVSESGAAVWNTFVAPFVVDRAGTGAVGIEPLDRDGDGVASATDNCAIVWNAEQADFDADGVGDVCDLCPLGGAAAMIDADGCRVLPDAARAAVDELTEAVLRGEASVDDLVAKIDEVNR
jgi:Alpha amylase, catalytic domain